MPTAIELLETAAQHMKDRASTYDKPEGERSMAATVKAFNAITGHTLAEIDGWMFMVLLKMVRTYSGAEHHQDSLEDLIAYASLAAESVLTHEQQ